MENVPGRTVMATTIRYNWSDLAVQIIRFQTSVLHFFSNDLLGFGRRCSSTSKSHLTSGHYRSRSVLMVQ